MNILALLQCIQPNLSQTNVRRMNQIIQAIFEYDRSGDSVECAPRHSAFGTVLHVASRRGITEFPPSGRILLHLGTHLAPRPAGAGSYPVGLALGANSTGYSALQNKNAFEKTRTYFIGADFWTSSIFGSYSPC